VTLVSGVTPCLVLKSNFLHASKNARKMRRMAQERSERQARCTIGNNGFGADTFRVMRLCDRDRGLGETTAGCQRKQLA